VNETAAAAVLAVLLGTADGEPLQTRFFPLPLYATLPNEGSTYGVMPVWLRVGANSGETRLIYAPSASWNKVVHVTATFRGYRYWSATRSLALIASFSTRVNRGLTLEYLEQTRKAGQLTTDLRVYAKQNVFYRYFGLGPFTRPSDESSYTRLYGHASIREGINLADGVNVALLLDFRADRPRAIGVPGLPLTQTRFPDAPGLSGAVVVGQGVSLSYDSREGGDYAVRGFATELTGTANEGAANFASVSWHTRALIPETEWLQGAARLYVQRVFGSDIPFYYQSSLGGELLLRGFTENRFTDRGAWTADVEQRFRLFQTHIFGVVADWRVDAFGAVGQVFEDPADAFRKIRASGGLGFRAWVQPNVLGRVDLAYAGEGIQAYVVLGYPF
jgi:hypothetical protein